MSLKNPLENFDPNAPSAANSTLFGLPFEAANAELILISVPWEVSVSYGTGTSRAVYNILEASKQVDLFDMDSHQAWKKGIFLVPPDETVLSKSDYYRSLAEAHIQSIYEGKPTDNERLADINQAMDQTREWVKATTSEWLAKGKKVALIGGDHSTPLGFMQALHDREGEFGILQIDAHCDLRKAYEEIEFSHASIMYNALERIPGISKLVQIGIRDYCEEEYDYLLANPGRINCFFDNQIQKALFEGATWRDITDKIIEALPRKVYISFDIDGLDPKLCPNTGTPVPGGFELSQIDYLLHRILAAGKTIIGFDLSEVGNGESDWDANVGARVLWKLCNRFLSNPI